MKRLTGTPYVWKVIVPALWFGSLLVIALLSLRRTGFSLATHGMLMVMALVGYFVWREYAWSFLDEVIDEGDSLFLRKGNISQRVSFHDIVHITSGDNEQTSRITIHLSSDGKLGKDVCFYPSIDLNRSAYRGLVEELRERAEHAKST
ncbi:MAG: hypothetical protein AAF004_02760 [Pseudomonadota bacterium]